MNNFEAYMLGNVITENIQKKMEQATKKQKGEYQPEPEIQGTIKKGFKVVQAIRNWIGMNTKRKQDALLQ